MYRRQMHVKLQWDGLALSCPGILFTAQYDQGRPSSLLLHRLILARAPISLSFLS